MEELKPTVRDFKYCMKALENAKKILLQDFNKQVDIKTPEYWKKQPLEEMQKKVDRLNKIYHTLGKSCKCKIKYILDNNTFSEDELKDILKQLEEKTK